MDAPNNNHKNLLEIITKTGAIGILAYIIIYFGGAYLTKISEMQKDLIQIRIELTKIQTTLLSKDDIQAMINQKMQLHEASFHRMK